MDPDRVYELLSDFELADVYFGSEGFRIFSTSEIPDGQLGYARHPDGSDLTGIHEGDWRANWIVFGCDTSVGDPYFVDVDDPNLPVFTAMHGAGAWEPEAVSGSLEAFLGCLKYLKTVSSGDYAQIEPDETTLVDEEALAKLEAQLNGLNGGGSFWTEFLDRHREWILESEL